MYRVIIAAVFLVATTTACSSGRGLFEPTWSSQPSVEPSGVECHKQPRPQWTKLSLPPSYSKDRSSVLY